MVKLKKRLQVDDINLSWNLKGSIIVSCSKIMILPSTATHLFQDSLDCKAKVSELKIQQSGFTVELANKYSRCTRTLFPSLERQRPLHSCFFIRTF